MYNVNIEGSWTHRYVSDEETMPWAPVETNLFVAGGAKVVAAGVGGLKNTLYHALGSGDVGWAGGGIPAPGQTDTKLVAEYARRPADNVTYIDERVGPHIVDSPNIATQLQSPVFGDLGEALLINRFVEVVDGTAKGETKTITAVAGDVITLDSSLGSTPDHTTIWRVGVVSEAPTNVIDVQTTFPAQEANATGSAREEALFGAGATDSLDSGVMLNVFRHGVQHKAAKFDFVRVVRLRFSIA